MERQEITIRIVDTIQQFSKISKVWIYGSFSRQDNGLDSDIDIAIETDEGFSYFDLADIQWKLENQINRKIDIGFFDSFKPNVLKRVKPDLKLIYERSGS